MGVFGKIPNIMVMLLALVVISVLALSTTGRAGDVVGAPGGGASGTASFAYCKIACVASEECHAAVGGTKCSALLGKDTDEAPEKIENPKTVEFSESATFSGAKIPGGKVEITLPRAFLQEKYAPATFLARIINVDGGQVEQCLNQVGTNAPDRSCDEDIKKKLAKNKGALETVDNYLKFCNRCYSYFPEKSTEINEKNLPYIVLPIARDKINKELWIREGEGHSIEFLREYEPLLDTGGNVVVCDVNSPAKPPEECREYLNKRTTCINNKKCVSLPETPKVGDPVTIYHIEARTGLAWSCPYPNVSENSIYDPGKYTVFSFENTVRNSWIEHTGYAMEGSTPGKTVSVGERVASSFLSSASICYPPGEKEAQKVCEINIEKVPSAQPKDPKNPEPQKYKFEMPQIKSGYEVAVSYPVYAKGIDVSFGSSSKKYPFCRSWASASWECPESMCAKTSEGTFIYYSPASWLSLGQGYVEPSRPQCRYSEKKKCSGGCAYDTDAESVMAKCVLPKPEASRAFISEKCSTPDSCSQLVFSGGLFVDNPKFKPAEITGSNALFVIASVKNNAPKTEVGSAAFNIGDVTIKAQIESGTFEEKQKGTAKFIDLQVTPMPEAIYYPAVKDSNNKDTCSSIKPAVVKIDILKDGWCKGVPIKNGDWEKQWYDIGIGPGEYLEFTISLDNTDAKRYGAHKINTTVVIEDKSKIDPATSGSQSTASYIVYQSCCSGCETCDKGTCFPDVEKRLYAKMGTCEQFCGWNAGSAEEGFCFKRQVFEE